MSGRFMWSEVLGRDEKGILFIVWFGFRDEAFEVSLLGSAEELESRVEICFFDKALASEFFGKGVIKRGVVLWC